MVFRHFVTSLVAILGVAFPLEVWAQVSGIVRDADTNEPIVGAVVAVQASEIETVTGDDGTFELADATGNVVVVGANKGYFNYGVTVDSPATDVELLLEAVPSEEDANYEFVAPETCGGCHMEQYMDWMDSPMGKAGENTWVYDAYDGSGTEGGEGGFVYTRDSVLASENPNSECRSCHQPEGWAYEPYSALGDLSNPTDAMMHGVSCEMCHKVANIDESKPNFPGIWPGVVTLTRPSGFQVEYGPLNDVDYYSEGKMRASYQPQISAALCAACHQDKNDPDNDGDFEEDDGVISEPTYIEWLESPYADPDSENYQTCATCHMPATGAKQACMDISLDRPEGDVREHSFRGTSAEFLENAVSLSMTTEVVDGDVNVSVTITNDQTGHSVPTGVTIRNMILLVEATRVSDEQSLDFTGDQTVHELGGVGDPEQGYYAGLPGKMYAKVNYDQDGNSPTFFTDAAGIEFDNRIEALDSDTTNYVFTIPNGGGDVNVTARLIYRRSWRALTDAKAWTLDGHGNVLEDVTEPYFGHLMEEATETVEIESTVECTENDDCEEGEVCEENECVSDSSTSSTSSTSSGGESDSSESDSNDDGCGCRLVSSESNSKLPLIGVLVGLVAIGIRRKRRVVQLPS